jgi:hypothetical protein
METNMMNGIEAQNGGSTGKPWIMSKIKEEAAMEAFIVFHTQNLYLISIAPICQFLIKFTPV